jgi:hypothetical protein
MTARALRGVDMIRDAATETRCKPTAYELTTITGIPVVTFRGLTRTGLSVKEFAELSRYTVPRIRAEVSRRRIKADRGGQAYVIPVAELAVPLTWAD